MQSRRKRKKNPAPVKLSFVIYAESKDGEKFVWSGNKFYRASRTDVRPARFGTAKAAVHVGRDVVEKYNMILKGLRVYAGPWRR